MAQAVAMAVITAKGLTGATAFAITASAAVVDLAITSAYQRKKTADAQKDAASAPRDVTIRSAVEPARIIYGKARTSGPVVYTNTQPTPGTSDNSTLWTAISLANHECESIEEVWLDGDQILWSGLSGTGGVQSGKYGPIGSNEVTNFYAKLGTDSQTALSELVNAFSDWTSSYTGNNVTYLVSAFELGTATGEGVWAQGAPQNIRAVVKGKKVYDPRKDTTNGGSGSHRLADPSTWEWSDNPALCLADYLFDDRLGLGSEGVTYNDIDWDMVADAADICDSVVSVPGGSEKRFTCNGVLSTGTTYADNVRALASAMNGMVTWSGGKYRIRACAYEAPTYTFTEDDIVGDVQVQPELTRSRRFNAIRGTYIDPESDYNSVEFIPVTNTTYQNVRDNGQQLYTNISLPMTNSEYMAQRIGYKSLNLNNQQLTAVVPLNWKALKVGVGDRIQLNVSELGWSNKIFVVENWSFEPDKGFVLSVKEDSSSAYNDPAAEDYSTRTAGGQVVFADQPVSAPSGIQATSEEEAILVEWDAPPRGSGYDEVIVYASADSSWANASEVARTRSTSFRHELARGTTRYYWVRSVDVDGQFSIRDPDSDTSSVTATAGQISTSQLDDDANFALTADWESITDSGNTKPEDNATYNIGALADLDTVGTNEIDDNAVDITKIADTLQSTNYSAGSAGWKLTTDGTFEAGNGTFRGALTATSGSIDSSVTIGGTAASTVVSGAAAGATALQIGDIAEIISAGNIPTGQLTFNDSGSKTVSYDGNNISVTGGNDNSWDTQVYSSEHYASPCVLQFETTFNSTYRFMMGLNEDPTTNASYNSIDYSWYLNTSTATIYENGAQAAPDGGSFSYSVGDKFSIVYDGDNVYYYHNDTLKRTVTGVGAKDFYLDSSLYDTPLTINDVRFAPISRIDYGSIGGVTITPGKLYQGTGTFNNSNTGFYLDSTGQFSLKDKLSFNGTTLAVDGNVTAQSLTLAAGVKVGAGNIAYDDVTLTNSGGNLVIKTGGVDTDQIADDAIYGSKISAATTIVAGSGSNSAALSGVYDYRFWAGGETPAINLPFLVHKDGTVYARKMVLKDSAGNELFNSETGFTNLSINQIVTGTGSTAIKVTTYSEAFTDNNGEVEITLSQQSNLKVGIKIDASWEGSDINANQTTAETNAIADIPSQVQLGVGYASSAGGTFVASSTGTFSRVTTLSGTPSDEYLVEATSFYEPEVIPGGAYIASASVQTDEPTSAVGPFGYILYEYTFNNLAAGTYYFRTTASGTGGSGANVVNSNYDRTIEITDLTTDGGFVVDGGGSQTVGQADITSVTINTSGGITGGASVLSGAATFNLSLDSSVLTTSTTFGGDVSGTYNNIVVANDSHTHDGRYYTETEADSRFVNAAGDTMTGNLKFTSGNSAYFETSALGGFIPFPGGGQYVTNSSSHTGAIKIGLPVHGPADMISFYVDVYDYSTNEAFTVFIAGYAYQTTGNNEWVNLTVRTDTTNTAKDFTVRFGGDGSRNCVWIGETTSTWSYPQVTVRDVQVGYTADVDAWADGWSVSFATAFDTVQNVISNNLPLSSSAAKWTTARTITLGGDLTGSVSIDGSANATLTADLAWNTSDTFSGTYSLAWNASDNLYTASWLQVRGSDDSLLTRNIVADGYVDASGGYKESGIVIVDSSRRFYVNGSIQHSSRISFLDGSNGNTGSGAQGIAVQSVYAGTSYSNTAPSGMVNALNGYQVGNTTVINSSRNATFVGVEGTGIGVDNTSSTTQYGIALYGGYGAGTNPTYGLLFTGTAGLGTHGSVTGDWATYFTMNNSSGRGWIFRDQNTPANVASISNAGYLTATRLYTGDGNDGFFYSDTNGRTAFASGDFYIQDTVGNFYNYATNQYYGASSGDNIYFRGNTLAGDGWNLDGSGNLNVAADYVRLFNYTHGTVPTTVGIVSIHSGGKTGWAPGDELGRLRWYADDASGNWPAEVAAIKAVNRSGNGSTTTVGSAALEFYTSPYNVSSASLALRLDLDQTADFQNDVKMGGTTIVDSSRNLTNISQITADDVRVTAGDGEGYGFWSSALGGSYRIYMSSASNGTYGGQVTGETTSDYNMYFKMEAGTNRGFVFRNASDNYFSINPNGVYSEVAYRDPVMTRPYITASGSSSSDDQLLTRWRYANANSYYLDLHQRVSSNQLRWAFSVKNGGSTWADRLVFKNANVGIGGTQDPEYPLDVVGMARIQAGGSRPIEIGDNGSIWSQGNSGGWAMGYKFKGSAGTGRGGFGGYGGGDAITYWWVGQDYNDADALKIYPDGSVVLDSLTLRNSPDRPGLLDVYQTGTGWMGYQISNNLGEHWSFMGNDGAMGLYDDQNNDWALLYYENAYVSLYYNGSEKIRTDTVGARIYGKLKVGATSTPSAGSVRQVLYADDDTSSYLQITGSANTNGILLGTDPSGQFNFYSYTGAIGSESYGSVKVRFDSVGRIHAPFGMNGSYGDLVAGSSNWGACIWSIGDAWAGTGAGSTYSIGNYGLHWIRSAHASEIAFADEGLYLTRASTTPYAAIGRTGAYFATRLASTDNITAYYSDERLKEKTGVIENALDKVRSLEGFTYVENELARELGYNNTKEQVGLSAQQVQAVLPHAVSLAPVDYGDRVDGEIVSKSGEDYLTVDYSRLVPLLVESIKELSTEVERLKKQLEKDNGDK